MGEPSQALNQIPPASSAANAELNRIWYALDCRMKRPKGKRTKRNRQYICEVDIRDVWSQPNQIRSAFSGYTLNDEHELYISQNMLLLLSCLIWVTPTADALQCFWDFWDQRLDDRKLPLERIHLRKQNDWMIQHFMEDQFAFIPYVIKLTRDVEIINVGDKQLRMPFEHIEKRIGVGGYGDVDKVYISTDHLHSQRGGDKVKNTEASLVACKKVRTAKGFKDEVKNIRILRESITTHNRIMTHIGALKHGDHHYILFPYAEFGDLRQFLDQKTDGQSGYKHAKALPGPATSDSDIAVSLILQLWQICDALKWLHSDVRLEDGGDKVVCVHMDLRPDNILIRQNDTAAKSYNRATDVGSWVISDFGISVFKDDPTHRYDVDYLSIGDFIDLQEPAKQTTVMEEPRRGPGTHQAPEFERYHTRWNGIPAQSTRDSSNRSAAGVGRRSDVWSFGCICAEVLAFQVGRQAEVQNFLASRDQNGDANFYEPLSGGTLQPGPTTEFRVRRSVLKWLHAQTEKPCDQQWIECFVGYIKKTLVVDPKRRPTTEDLEKYMRHVYRHVSKSKQAELYPCEMVRPTQRPEPPKPSMPVSSDTPKPGLKTYPTLDELTKFHTGPSVRPQSKPPGQVPLPTATNDGPHAVSHPSISITTPQSIYGDPQSPIHVRKDSRQSPSPVDTPKPQLSTTSNPNTPGSLISPTMSDNESSRTPKSMPAYAVPQNLNGIFIKPDINRRAGKTYSENVPGFGKKEKTKLFAANTACNGDHQLKVGYVLADAVHFFEVDSQIMRHRPALTTKVPPALQIRELILSGDYVAVLGTRQGQNTVYICERTSPQFKELSSIPTGSVRICSKVVVSQLGLVAAVCDNVIYVVCVADSKIVGTLTTAKGASFSDAAFNECGNRLFAWAFGRDKDVLHVWRCDGKMPIEDAKEAMTSYDAIKDKAASTRVLPYSSYQGSIIKASGQRYSAAQIRGSTLGIQDSVKLDWILIENAKVAIIYQDHSLLTLEQPLRPWEGCRLVERRIEYPGNYDLGESGVTRRSSMQTTHILSSRGELIHRFDSKAKDNSRLLIVRADDEIIILLYNDDGKAEWVQLVPN